ncbi:MAG: hypothetical protein AMXMBFR83_20550 [Phycisphaerae bacterium]|jgi:predicted Zn finger-like uncharacterized protein
MSSRERVQMACPVCGARYVVPPEKLSAGRVLKCRRCDGVLGRGPRRPTPPVTEDLILAWLNEPEREEA